MNWFKDKYPEISEKFILPDSAQECYELGYKLLVDECFTNDCFLSLTKYWHAAIGVNDFDIIVHKKDTKIHMEPATIWIE